MTDSSVLASAYGFSDAYFWAILKALLAQCISVGLFNKYWIAKWYTNTACITNSFAWTNSTSAFTANFTSLCYWIPEIQIANGAVLKSDAFVASFL